MGHPVLFYIISTLLVVSSLGVVLNKKSLKGSFVSLLGTLAGLAAMFALLDANFVAAVQLLVHAGAVIALFLFVYVLLDFGANSATNRKLGLGEAVVLIVSAVTFGTIAVKVFGGSIVTRGGELTQSVIDKSGGNTRVLGLQLFQNYAWVLEVTALLMLLTIVACVLINKLPDTGTASKEPS